MKSSSTCCCRLLWVLVQVILLRVQILRFHLVQLLSVLSSIAGNILTMLERRSETLADRVRGICWINRMMNMPELFMITAGCVC